MCLPLELVCDGKPQCPLADDEKYCDRKSCPDQCSCSALSFDCSEANLTEIPKDLDANIRQLNLKGNHLTSLSHGFKFPFLIHLILEQNSIAMIKSQTFRYLANLQLLNLRSNRLKRISEGMFDGLKSLKELDLFGNFDIDHIDPFAFRSLSNLPELELTNLKVFAIEPYTFSGLDNLKKLTFTNSKIETIKSHSFRGLESLISLDLRGNPLHYVKMSAFKTLKDLQFMKSDTFKLCCMAKQVPRSQCEPPEDPISSCEDLMSNNLLRSFIWILGILACFGNAVVLSLRCKNPLTNISEFIISNLAISDLLVIYCQMFLICF